MANNVRISVSVDNDTSRGLAEVRAALAALRASAMDDIHVDVNADTDGVTEAETEIAALHAEADDDVNVRVRVDDDDVSRARREIGSLGSVRLPFLRSKVSVEGLALIAPMAAQAAAAVLSIGAAAVGAGAALGSIAVAALPGLMEIRNALKLHTQAMNENTASVAKAAGPNYALISAKQQLANAVRSASRSIADADEALADAERDLGRAARQNAEDIASARRQVVNAEKSVTTAERNLADANKNATDAQKALNDARKEAADDLKSLNDQLIDSQLSTEDATLAVADAQKRLQQVMKDPTADNIQRAQAQLTLAQAKQTLKERTEANDKLKKSAADQARAGVEGSQKVKDAEDRLSQAKDQQVQAAQAVADAQQGVADAIQNVAQVQQDASDRMADAQERVADAVRNVARAHEDAASSISSAQLGVQQAMQSTADATAGAETAAEKYQDALAKMNPATRATYDALLKLKSAFKQWGDSLAPDVMPIFTNGIYILIDLLPKLTPLVKGAAKVVGDLVSKFRTKLEHGDYDKMIDKFNSWSVSSLKRIVGLIGDLKNHIKNMVMSQNFKDFMKDVNDNGPRMADTLQKLGDFIGRFIVAAGPMAGLSFKVLDSLATTLNAIPMPVLDVLAPTILAIAAGLKVMALANALENSQLLIMSGILDSIGIGELMLLIGLLILALVELVKHHKEVAKAIAKAWGDIKKAVKTAYDWLVKNVFNPIGTFFTKTIPNAGNKMVSWFAGLPKRITSATKGMFDGIKNAFRAAMNWVIDKWNGLSFKIGGQKVFGVSLPGVTISTPNLPHMAHGGISGGGLAMVGENGRELVQLPSGSRVRTAPDTERIMSQGNKAQAISIHFEKSGDPLMDLILDHMKDRIRVRHGKNVEAALGKG